MERIPEPELMETKKQVLSYLEGDFSKGEKNFINFISTYLIDNKISLSKNNLIVDLGCGPGNITEKLSQKWPKVPILGVDGSQEMINAAKYKKNLKTNGHDYKNIEYICADIKKIGLNSISPQKNVSLLVSNSLIHHITSADEFFECICKLSTKETINFHKDLIRPKDEKTALKLKAKSALKFSETLANDYFASLKASYRVDELKNIISEKMFSSLDVIKDGEEYLILYGKVKN